MPRQGALLLRCQDSEAALAAAQERMRLLRQDAEAATSHASALEADKAALLTKYAPAQSTHKQAVCVMISSKAGW